MPWLSIGTKSLNESTCSKEGRDAAHLLSATVCRVIFFRPLLFSSYICKRSRPILNSLKQSCGKWDIIWDIGIRVLLNSTTDNKGERGETISLYILSSEIFLLHNDDRANIYAALPLAWKQLIGFKCPHLFWRLMWYKLQQKTSPKFINNDLEMAAHFIVA